MAELYPLVFGPIYKEKIWGGKKFADLFRRVLPGENIGESWDISVHPEGMSRVQNGCWAGRTLLELCELLGADLLGTKVMARTKGSFPLLFKFIDANENLSVQVHPDDDYAARFEPEESGKTELWYVIHASKGAQIVYGLKPGVNKERFRLAITRGSDPVLDCLNFVTVQPGDVFFIPAGLVHALGAGVVVAEIQQSSNAVYRVYDWDRLDDCGRSRPLHVDKALDVIRFDGRFPDNNPHFVTEFGLLTGEKTYTLGGSFHIVACFSGTCEVQGGSGVTLKAGMSCVVPAGLGQYRLAGNADTLVAWVPES